MARHGQDGTLMNSRHTLPEAHLRALQSCLRHGVPVILATGKHRGPWVRRLLSALPASSDWTLNAAGVFVQGLLVCDARGRVRHKKLLEAAICRGLQRPGGAAPLDLAGLHRALTAIFPSESAAFKDSDAIWSSSADAQDESPLVRQPFGPGDLPDRCSG